MYPKTSNGLKLSPSLWETEPRVLVSLSLFETRLECTQFTAPVSGCGGAWGALTRPGALEGLVWHPLAAPRTGGPARRGAAGRGGSPESRGEHEGRRRLEVSAESV